MKIFQVQFVVFFRFYQQLLPDNYPEVTGQDKEFMIAFG